MSDKKFLFFDMDGTLIAPKTRRIPQSAIDGIQQAMKNGHHCFICTGRSYRMAQEYFDQLAFPGIVFCNGAGIAYDGEILETRDLEPGWRIWFVNNNICISECARKKSYEPLLFCAPCRRRFRRF